MNRRRLPVKEISMLHADDSTQAREAELLTTGEAGNVLHVSAQRVRAMEEAGLLCSLRTANGRRLFRRDDVLALALAGQGTG